MNLGKPLPLSFESDRLFIRRYETSDEQALFEAARSSVNEIFPFLPWCHPDYNITESRDWLAQIRENWRNDAVYNFCIWDQEQTEFHGGCGITRVDEHPVGNLGYWIKTASTRRGIATEATIALACFGFEHIGLSRIEIIMSVENPASRAVAEGAGATLEGRMRNRLLLHGRVHDAWLYSLTPGDMGL